MREVARGRTLAHDEPAPSQVVRQVLGGDAGHDVVRLVGALAPGEPQRKGQGADQLFPRSGRKVVVLGQACAPPLVNVQMLNRVLEQIKN